MKYLKLYEDKVENSIAKQLVDIKSLPYNEFMPRLLQVIQDPNLKDKIQTSFKSTDSIKDYGNSTEESISADKLIPTQSQIGLKESLSWMSNQDSIYEIIVDGKASIFNNNKILVLNKKWIIEGQHKWAYAYLLNPSCKLPCININLPDQSPVSVIKDIQIALAATYGDLYVQKTEIKYDIHKMDDGEIDKAIEKIIPDDYVLLLQKAYANTSLVKRILKQVVPKTLVESRQLKSYDYQELLDEKPDDRDIKKLDDEEDKEGEEEIKEPGAADKISEWLSIAGWVEPTGIADILAGAISIYQGNYLIGFFKIMSALPMADFACKGIVKVLEGAAAKQFTKLLGKSLRKFDAKSAAKIWMKLEKQFPQIGPYLKTVVDLISTMCQKIGQIAEIISKHWLKFKVVQTLFQTKIVNFFKDLLDFKISLKDYIEKVPEEKVYEIISTNAKEIKGLMVDKQVDKFNITLDIAPRTVQSAMKAGFDPKTKGFKGVPKRFLEVLPNVTGSIKNIQQSKMPKFNEFEPERGELQTPKVEFKEKQPTKVKTKEVKPSKKIEQKPVPVKKNTEEKKIKERTK